MANRTKGADRRGGRKKNNPPLRPIIVRLTEDQIKLVRTYGRGDFAAGLRWLIDSSAPLIVKVEVVPDRPRSSE